MTLALILTGIAATLAIVAFGTVGFAAFSMAAIIDSSEDLGESTHDDGEDLAGRIGSALWAILEMPYTRSKDQRLAARSEFSARRPEINRN